MLLMQNLKIKKVNFKNPLNLIATLVDNEILKEDFYK